MKVFASLVLALTIAVAPACKKKEEAPAAKPTPAEPAPAEPAPATGKQEPAPAPAATADFISVFASHAEPKPNDPVEVKFTGFSVTKASFDPANLEGGTATISIDLATLNSGSDKRDGHLKSEAYIDLSKFTTATIDVSNVKKKDEKHYTADAKVDFHGAQKTYPVEFEVIETGADSVKIRGEQRFARADFAIGKEPGAEESVAKELHIKVQLTLKKT